MRRLGKAVKSLKYHFYQIKKSKFQWSFNKRKNNTRTSQGNKSDKKSNERLEKKNLLGNVVLTMTKVPIFP